MKHQSRLAQPRSRRSGEPHKTLLGQISGLTESQAITLIHRFGSDLSAIERAAARLAGDRAMLLPQRTD
jgi:hypothetical protein